MEVKFKPQKDFPLRDEYAKIFKITPATIFAFFDTIYSDDELPDHLIVHETVHLKRQQKQGPDAWVENYLTDPKFRLHEEIVAYQAQLKSIKSRDFRHRVRTESARNLAGPLYGNICTEQEALTLLL